jgi:hypothetical protein
MNAGRSGAPLAEEKGGVPLQRLEPVGGAPFLDCRSCHARERARIDLRDAQDQITTDRREQGRIPEAPRSAWQSEQAGRYIGVGEHHGESASINGVFESTRRPSAAITTCCSSLIPSGPPTSPI